MCMYMYVIPTSEREIFLIYFIFPLTHLCNKGCLAFVFPAKLRQKNLPAHVSVSVAALPKKRQK